MFAEIEEKERGTIMANASENAGGMVTIRITPGMQLTAEARKKLDDLTAKLQKTGVKVVPAIKCLGFSCSGCYLPKNY